MKSQNPVIINANIRGVVIDSQTNTPLPGASVLIQGTTNGDLTDHEGVFHLKTGQQLPFRLMVTFVGYQPKEIQVNQEKVTVFLDPVVGNFDDVIISSRRRREASQEVPIAISVIQGAKAEDAGAFNANRLKELIPSVQLYASNARNTTLNIRGMGSTFGLTNDGIDPGVGFYVDGVYYARPAVAALDFVDIEQIEVLRGPQGTLFGKNTTAGAFNITTRAPAFEPGASLELSYGNFGFTQAKAAVTGPLSKTLAARFSFSGTKRDGLFLNHHTQLPINDQNNLGFRNQLLFKPAEHVKITLSGDWSVQKPNGYGWPVAGIVTTQRASFRQIGNILADLDYSLPYKSAFDKIVDLDTPSKADNHLGGVSVQTEINTGIGTFTSTTAWRHWKWVPLNDRDYLGLPVFTISSGNSKHDQWSQELRYSGRISERITGVAGLFGLWQNLNTDPVHTEEVGAAQWRFAQNNSNPLWQTPGLLDHYGIRTRYGIRSTSMAVFGQADWKITEKIHFMPGVRYNYDKKTAHYTRETYGGLLTNDPALTALKNSVYTSQAFQTANSDGNFSGQLSLQYKPSRHANVYAAYAISYKPMGVNVGGLPSNSGRVMQELANIRPEFVKHQEIGVKTKPLPQSILNLTFYRNEIEDYQTLVQTPEPGVNRGYLANAEKVRVTGAELDGNIRFGSVFTLTGAFAFTNGKYVSFANAPVPLEETGGERAYKDISGGRLPGISKWSGSTGAEVVTGKHLLGLKGNFFLALDHFFRSEFSSSVSPSQYLNIDGYSVVNIRTGFRASNGLTVFVWSRNLFDKDYFEQLLAAPGSHGQYAGIPGDPRTFGITLRFIY